MEEVEGSTGGQKYHSAKNREYRRGMKRRGTEGEKRPIKRGSMDRSREEWEDDRGGGRLERRGEEEEREEERERERARKRGRCS